MDTTLIFGLSAAAIVVLLVQVAKAVNLPMAAAPWFSLLCSFLAVGLGLLVKLLPASLEFVEAIIAALTIFIGSSGAYTVVKNLGENMSLTTGVSKNPDKPEDILKLQTAANPPDVMPVMANKSDNSKAGVYGMGATLIGVLFLGLVFIFGHSSTPPGPGPHPTPLPFITPVPTSCATCIKPTPTVTLTVKVPTGVPTIPIPTGVPTKPVPVPTAISTR